MRVLLGLGLGGASFTARDVDGGGVRPGEPVWGPDALLRDLELRLAIPPTTKNDGTRVAQYAERVRALGPTRAFYAASFAADDIGTAETLLAWRDALVDAGWDGKVVSGGGERLGALAAIEGHPAGPLPLGVADRLASVERELATCASRIYVDVSLIEDRAGWPLRWQRIFQRLETLGTRFERARPALPGAVADTDLGALQRLLRDNVTANAAGSRWTPRGDGSILVLRGETPTELGELVAAILGKEASQDVLVVRPPGSAAPLDAAFAHRGLPTQGVQSTSAWRPATQILALALELAFEPRDPYRVLELLTLPVGPFRGQLGRALAKAVGRQPGIGGQEWRRRKADAALGLRESEARRQRAVGRSDDEAVTLADAYVARRMQRVTDWLETPGADAAGISRERLLEITARVRAWVQPQAGADSPSAHVYRVACAQALAFSEAIANGASATLAREQVQHVFDAVARSTDPHDTSLEEAGRYPHVEHPSAVFAAAGTVILWNFVAGTERSTRALPWNHTERGALEQAGVVCPDPLRSLADEATSWRRAILAARDRVVFVMPRSVKGTATATHPVWDEVVARLGIEGDTEAVECFSRSIATILDDQRQDLAAVASVAPLALPDARAVWNVGPGTLEVEGRNASATAIQALVSCPLSWVLEHVAGIRAGAVAKVAVGTLLNGNLSHRLVEELFTSGAFDLDERAFVASVDDTLRTLIRSEGATLLLDGAAFEHAQLSSQIRRAMRELHRYLRAAKFRIAAVEETIQLGSVGGRLDVRLVDDAGKDAVLDLKWGASSYRKLLAAGRAIQLAVYALALRAQKGRTSVPPAAYYAIASATVLTTDLRMRAPSLVEGIPLDETWRRVERTRAAVTAALERGEVPVANTRRALPLLDALAVRKEEHDGYYAAERDAACKYCSFQGLCGRAWESYS